MDWQDVGDVVLCQKLPISCICGSQRKSRNCKYSFHPITNHLVCILTYIKHFLPNNKPPLQMSPKQMWLYGLKVLLLFWTERKTGKPVFLKQSNSLAQKQETVIVLIKFCSLKGSQMFSTLDRCVCTLFSQALQVLQEADDATYTRPRWVCTEPPCQPNEFK